MSTLHIVPGSNAASAFFGPNVDVERLFFGASDDTPARPKRAAAFKSVEQRRRLEANARGPLHSSDDEDYDDDGDSEEENDPNVEIGEEELASEDEREKDDLDDFFDKYAEEAYVEDDDEVDDTAPPDLDGDEFADEDADLASIWANTKYHVNTQRDEREERTEQQEHMLLSEIYKDLEEGPFSTQRQLMFLVRAFKDPPKNVLDYFYAKVTLGDLPAVEAVAKFLGEDNELFQEFKANVSEFRAVARTPLLFSGPYLKIAWRLFSAWAAARILPELQSRHPNVANDMHVLNEVLSFHDEYTAERIFVKKRVRDVWRVDPLRALGLVYLKALQATEATWERVFATREVIDFMEERDMRGDYKNFSLKLVSHGYKKDVDNCSRLYFYHLGKRNVVRFYSKNAKPYLRDFLPRLRTDPVLQEFCDTQAYKDVFVAGISLIRVRKRTKLLPNPCSELQRWDNLVNFPPSMWIVPSKFAASVVIKVKFREEGALSLTPLFTKNYEVSKDIVAKGNNVYHLSGDDIRTVIADLSQEVARDITEERLIEVSKLKINAGWVHNATDALFESTKRTGSVRKTSTGGAKESSRSNRIKTLLEKAFLMGLRNRTSSKKVWRIDLVLYKRRKDHAIKAGKRKFLKKTTSKGADAGGAQCAGTR